MTSFGLFFDYHWPVGEWWTPPGRYSAPIVGMYFEGEHQEEADAIELGDRVAGLLACENPPYPGWAP